MKYDLDSSALRAPPLALRPRPVRRPTLQGFAGLVLLWVQRDQTRRALAALDPERLADVGIDAVQARREVRKPFWRE